MFDQDIEVVAIAATSIMSVLGLVARNKYEQVKSLIHELDEALKDDKLTSEEVKSIYQKIQGLVR